MAQSADQIAAELRERAAELYREANALQETAQILEGLHGATILSNPAYAEAAKRLRDEKGIR